MSGPLDLLVVTCLSKENEPVEPLAWSLATDPPAGKFAAVFVATTQTDADRVAEVLRKYRASIRYAVGVPGPDWGSLVAERYLLVPASCVPARGQFRVSGLKIFDLVVAGPKTVLYLDHQGTNLHPSMFKDVKRTPDIGWLGGPTKPDPDLEPHQSSDLLVLVEPSDPPTGVTICHTN